MRFREMPVPRNRPDDDTLGSSGLDSYMASPEQQERANILKRLVTNLERAGVRYSIPGGYGLDGLYGRLTRDHGDIDVMCSPEDAGEVRKVIEAAGFKLGIVKIISNVEVYEHQRTHAKLELTPVNKFSEYTEMDDSEFFPIEQNAHIDNAWFRTPTLAGHKELTRIQHIRAEAGQWGPYEHEEWKQRMFAELEKAMKRGE